MSYFKELFEEQLKNDNFKVFSTKLNKTLKLSKLKIIFEKEINSIKEEFKITKRINDNTENKLHTELTCKWKGNDDSFNEIFLKNFLQYKYFFSDFKNIKIFKGLDWLPEIEFNNFYLKSLKNENYLRLRENNNKGIIITFYDIFEKEN